MAQRHVATTTEQPPAAAGPGGGPDAGAAHGAARRAWRERGAVVLFVLPAITVYVVFVAYPIVTTFYYSLLEWSGFGLPTFIGFDNFRTMIGDSLVWRSLWHNAILVVASLGIQLPIGLALALLLFSSIRGTRFFRTVYFMPLLMSTVAVGILWSFIYNPTFGVINNVLGFVGLDALQRGWLGDADTALGAIIAVIAWQYIPFYMILFRAGITSIPEDLYEAAHVDGANSPQRLRFITLPLLRGTIRTAVLLSVIGSLKYFDLIWIMTLGGPSGATELMSTYMVKQAFTRSNLGYGSAIAVVLFLLALCFTVAVLYRTQRHEGE